MNTSLIPAPYPFEFVSIELGLWKKRFVLVCLNPSEIRNSFPLLSPQRGYDDLQTIVPTCQQQDFSIGSQKLSKAIVLQKSMAGESTGGVGARGL